MTDRAPLTEHSSTGRITVEDAHLRNLRHVDVSLPRDALVAVTGVSGSGKSSLAFGTIHGEAQRRYLESVAPFARRLIAGAVDPQVTAIHGLPPTVALEQNRTGASARSTVGTISTISNSVRLLFSRCGDYPAELRRRVGRLDSDSFSPNTAAGMCPTCQGTGTVHTPTERTMVPDPDLSIDDGAVAAWPGAWQGKNFHDILVTLGYRTDVPWRELPAAQREWILFTDETPVVTVHPVRGAHQIQRTYRGTWRSVSAYLRETLASTGSESTRRRVLSFMEHAVCPACGGRRLIPDALKVTWRGLTVDRLNALSLEDLCDRVTGTGTAGTGTTGTAGPASAEAERLLLNQLTPTLTAAVDLGLGHLSLDRAATTLSAGELQRLRLASQLHSGLFGVVYVLDEPSAGLHPTEREAVLDLVRRFIRAGNSVILVEHDMSLVAAADHVIDVGPVGRFACEGRLEVSHGRVEDAEGDRGGKCEGQRGPGHCGASLGGGDSRHRTPSRGQGDRGSEASSAGGQPADCRGEPGEGLVDDLGVHPPVGATVRHRPGDLQVELGLGLGTGGTDHHTVVQGGGTGCVVPRCCATCRC
uniref:hypothetical protein n=1 Tax=Corynebacterium provencense TaxID=1737425 RepID=UPI000A97A5A7